MGGPRKRLRYQNIRNFLPENLNREKAYAARIEKGKLSPVAADAIIKLEINQLKDTPGLIKQ